MRQYEFINISQIMKQEGWTLIRTTKDLDVYMAPGSNVEIGVPKKSICIRTTSD